MMHPTPIAPCSAPLISLRLALLVLATAGALLTNVAPAAAQWWRLGLGGDKSIAYQSFKDPAGRFTIDYPAKDWLVVPSAGSVLAGFSHRNGSASLSVDYTKLQLALAADEIDTLFVDLEIGTLKERQPKLEDVSGRLETRPSGPMIFIEFKKPGARGVERVTQFSYPRGSDLYRVVCTLARSDLAATFDPILAHMAESFTLLTPR